MNRADAYAKIREYNLQSEIKKTYGWNFTNLSTATLLEIISDYEDSMYEPDEFEGEPCVCECKLTKLIEILYKKHIICKAEYESLKA